MKKDICRGDIYFANLDPVFGSEQGGTRPVLILQNNIGNKYSPTVIVAAITSAIDKKALLPTHCSIKSAGLKYESIVLLEQLRTIDKERLSDKIGSIKGEDLMDQIDCCLSISLGLERYNKDFFEICLCPACMQQFREDPDCIVKRVDKDQTHRDLCTYCSSRMGWDYFVIKNKGIERGYHDNCGFDNYF